LTDTQICLKAAPRLSRMPRDFAAVRHEETAKLPEIPYLSFHHQNRQITRGKSVCACAAESSSAPNALLKLLHLDYLRRIDALEYELCDAVALAHGEVGIAVVEQQHLDLAAVVGVNDARARVDEVLGCEAGARGNAAV